MRVLHVITGLNAGGAEHQLRLLLRGLPHDCEVATLSNPGPVAEAIRAGGTAVHELTMRHNHDLSVLPKLRRLMRDGRYDVVHTHLYRACLFGRVAARAAGVPTIVATEHSLGDRVIEGRRTTPGVRALYRATERLGQATIAVSVAVAGRLAEWGVPEHRIAVVPNGIDATEFAFDPRLRRAARARLGIPQDALVIGGVGRLEPGKRFDRLIRAIAEVPDVTLLLVGHGPARAALEQTAAVHDVGHRVVFAGAVGHAREMLCAMDVFASPSDSETFGLAVLEALACGLPALYAECPPLDELTAPGAHAPPDTPGARRLTAYPEALPRTLRAELACLGERRGRRLPVPDLVARFDTGRLATSIGQLYERLAARPQRRTTQPLVQIKGARG
ncbi:glycosyltransferase [Actinoplanes sp. NBRC 103695]|uniref:glycosyltransferase n=1 Tax=Actinoplanes sp. NBRC 103695 TaxID=3032202 RepID=UPI0024A369A5|nr:glycosyltransferase [Actinoplanes sp. NBRC 103695]GLY94198.1 glycosyl transferase [Actinoplanes sp. NBRC 103695]